ncbi:hypothetical protein SAY86_018456 [Trapa natans]|uniref:Ribosomal protein L34Ae n=1 Tax=Trapa natans TaxID=22666 RepID=A0AAN7LJ35_TRANT|nr:hypothetical protein SAY86_018456 [Trapa natans]
MGAGELLLLGTDSNYFFGEVGGSLYGFMYGTMMRVVESLWVLLCNFFLCAFGSASNYIFRILDAGHEKREGSEGNERIFHFCDLQQETHETLKDAEPDGETWDGEKVLHHSFNSDDEDSGFLETSSSKYQFSFANNISGFVEEPKVLSFTVQEMFMDSVDSPKFSAFHFPKEAGISPEKAEDSVHETESADGSGAEHAIEAALEERGNFSDREIVENEEEISIKDWISSDTSAPKIDLGLGSLDSDDGFYANSEKIDSSNKPSISETDFKVESCTGNGFALGSFWDIDMGILEEVDEDSSSEESYKWDDDELAEAGDVPPLTEDRVQEALFSDEDEFWQEEKEQEEQGEAEFDDDEDLDSMSEHDEIIQQLKLDLKTARTGGLPTILEEEEESKNELDTSPMNMADDLMKPLKITDKKIEHKDRVCEIQKVYKNYAERMRKLDVLNYQTMQAIGLLHLKGPLKSNATCRPSSTMIRSILSQSLVPVRIRRNKIDPAEKSLEALYVDLEMIYVGQVCLSWEILQWQYFKSWELLMLDTYQSRQYNCVASEIQLFQVLLHRFIENEPFQGPRIENYVKNRCVVRSFLQVPALRDDSFREKKARLGKEDAIPPAAMIKIMEESIRAFWEFVRSDKEEGDRNRIHRVCRKSHFNLVDSADLELLITTRDHLQKKERKLKDILRSGNCIVKRFQKRSRDKGDQMLLLVFAQVEVRLISRVLNMAKLTRDQVIWCHEKLDRINFSSRKIHMEPSFLIFPC